MAPVGPVGLPEVRLVLHRRVAALHAPSEGSRAGHLLVGPIDAARGRDFDVVFLTGVVEKVFPPKLVDDPLLPDETKKNHLTPGLRDWIDSVEARLGADREPGRGAAGAARPER